MSQEGKGFKMSSVVIGLLIVGIVVGGIGMALCCKRWANRRSGDVAERLKKLKDLLDSGLIERGDYEKRKAELISQI